LNLYRLLYPKSIINEAGTPPDPLPDEFRRTLKEAVPQQYEFRRLDENAASLLTQRGKELFTAFNSNIPTKSVERLDGRKGVAIPYHHDHLHYTGEYRLSLDHSKRFKIILSNGDFIYPDSVEYSKLHSKPHAAVNKSPVIIPGSEVLREFPVVATFAKRLMPIISTVDVVFWYKDERVDVKFYGPSVVVGDKYDRDQVIFSFRVLIPTNLASIHENT
jgi:hypothetical protein